MRIGKLTSRELSNVLCNLSSRRKNTVLGAKIGFDCAVVEGEGAVFLSSDPITAAGERTQLGRLAVIVGCNDIAAAGVEPVALLITIIAPKDSTTERIAKIMHEAERAAVEYNVDIVGGHTEFSDAVVREVVCVTALGFKNSAIRYSPKVGDSVILSKELGLESAIINLEESGVDCDHLYPSLSVFKESRALSDMDDVLMHDVTEGGLLGAIDEIFYKSDLKAKINLDLVAVNSEARKIFKKNNLNIYSQLSSGCMLIITPRQHEALERLKKAGVSACVIGEVVWKKDC